MCRKVGAVGEGRRWDGAGKGKGRAEEEVGGILATFVHAVGSTG